MNFMCDVYVYEDVSGGWTTHVASGRLAFRPLPDLNLMKFPGNRAWALLWLWWHRLSLLSLKLIPTREIGLEHDGATFNHATPGECAAWLEHLREVGYCVPQYAIDDLREDQLEMDDKVNMENRDER